MAHAEHAQAIADAVGRLNAALQAAFAAGLRVDWEFSGTGAIATTVVVEIPRGEEEDGECD